MNLIEEFTRRIKDLREENNKTQKEISKYLEITQQQYSLYENAIRVMPIDMIKRLAKYYDVDMNYIVGITNVKKPYPVKEKQDYKNYRKEE